LRIFSFGGYGVALAAFALVVFGAIECPPFATTQVNPSEAKLTKRKSYFEQSI